MVHQHSRSSCSTSWALTARALAPVCRSSLACMSTHARRDRSLTRSHVQCALCMHLEQGPSGACANMQTKAEPRRSGRFKGVQREVCLPLPFSHQLSQNTPPSPPFALAHWLGNFSFSPPPSSSFCTSFWHPPLSLHANRYAIHSTPATLPHRQVHLLSQRRHCRLELVCADIAHHTLQRGRQLNLNGRAMTAAGVGRA